MLPRKTFGKLGNRALARLVTGVDATLVLPDRSSRCLLDNLSRKGCRLQLAEPPRKGATVIIRVERIDAIGTVAWTRGERCGIAFAKELTVQALERVRWMVENQQDHDKAKLSAATSLWR